MLVAFSAAVYARSKNNPVHAGNVNDEWDAEHARAPVAAWEERSWDTSETLELQALPACRCCSPPASGPWPTGHGLRGMACGAGGAAQTSVHGSPAAPHPIGRVIGLACFAVVALCVLPGIVYIVASGSGQTLGFEHVVPTLVDE